MKNLFNKLFLFALTGSFIFLYSCGEDEPEPTTDAPSIDFSVTGGTLNSTMDTVFVDFGGTIDWTFNITAPGGFNTFRLSGAVTAEFTRTDLGLDAGATSATVSASTGPWNQVGNFTITATAVDDIGTGQTSTADVVVSVSGIPARSLSAQLLFVPDLAKTSETFYSTNLGEAWTLNEVNGTGNNSINIDFGYFYGSSSLINIASPSDYVAYDLVAENWGALNTTTFKDTDLSATDFAEVTTWAAIDAAFDAGTNPENTKNGDETTVGKVIAFETDADKTDGAKRGLILISALVDDNENGEFDDVGDYVSIDIIVQEDAN